MPIKQLSELMTRYDSHVTVCSFSLAAGMRNLCFGVHSRLMFVKDTNIKGKFTGHLSAFSNFR